MRQQLQRRFDIAKRSAERAIEHASGSRDVELVDKTLAEHVALRELLQGPAQPPSQGRFSASWPARAFHS